MKEIEDCSREDRSRSKDKYDDASVLQMLEDKEVEDMSKLIVAQTTNLKRQTRRLAESKEEIALKDAALVLQTNEFEEVKRQLSKEKALLKVELQSKEMMADDLKEAREKLTKDRADAQLALDMQKLSIADELRAAKADVGKAHLQLADEKRAASHAVSLEMVKFRSAEQDAETRIIQAESQAQSKIVGEEQRVSRELARSRVVIAEEQTKVKNGTQLLEVKEESLKALRDDLTARDAEARAIQVSLDEQQLVVQKQSCSIAKTEAQMQSIHDDQKRKAELVDKT